jgi:hypothetical protein
MSAIVKKIFDGGWALRVTKVFPNAKIRFSLIATGEGEG